MSDLTRRVLEADQYMDRSPIPDWNKYDDARLILEDAAPTLARQVEAVEKLADRLEAEGIEGVRASNRTPHDSGWHDSQIIAAARIRGALNVTD